VNSASDEAKPLDIEVELEAAHVVLDAYSRGEPEPAWDGAGDTLDALIRALTELREARARIRALEAERDAYRKALADVSTWREDCHAHDADMGHEPRDFDEGEIACIERHASQVIERMKP